MNQTENESECEHGGLSFFFIHILFLALNVLVRFLIDQFSNSALSSRKVNGFSFFGFATYMISCFTDGGKMLSIIVGYINSI
ncbi:MAG: hypothetical protein RL582_1430 [Bacteroidota bacterium]